MIEPPPTSVEIEAARAGRSDREPCEHCGGPVAVRYGTDGNGRLILVDRALCSCAVAKKRRGECRDCNAPVEGQVNKALRCAFHKREAKKAGYRRHYWKDPERARRKDAEYRANRTQEQIERRAAQRRQRRIDRRESTNRYKKLKGDGGWGSREKYLAYLRSYNRKRREAMSTYNRRYRTFKDGSGPLCRDCGAPIPYPAAWMCWREEHRPSGRPMQVCEKCDPARWKTARRRKELQRLKLLNRIH